MIGVVAEGGVQTGCARLGRVSCCWAKAIGEKNDCASNKVMTLRARELHIMRILLQKQPQITQITQIRKIGGIGGICGSKSQLYGIDGAPPTDEEDYFPKRSVSHDGLACPGVAGD